MATSYKPRHEDITGADLTGTDATKDRTYALVHPNSIIAQMNIIVNKANLQFSIDYTFLNGVITFLGKVWDNQVITIDYLTEVTSSFGGTATYASTEELNQFMVMEGEIPNPQIQGDSRILEEVGTGNNTTTRFYVDNAFITSGTYTFYYGATELASLAQPLTETTHYSLDADLGILTLTTAGVSLVDTDKIYTAYKYNTLGFKDSELQDQLNRAQSRVEKKTRNLWVDGSVDTPCWEVITDETHDGRGVYAERYFAKNRPFPDISTNINGAAIIGETTITVDSTDGFPDSGLLGIDSEKITYSSKTSTVFTVTALTADHADDAEVLPFVFEASNTIDGVDPVWTVLSKGDRYWSKLNLGGVYMSETAYNLNNAITYDINPPLRVANRFRMSYIWGNSSIPEDINQLTLMVASQDLLHRAVRKAHTAGLNDFDPGLINVDAEWIKETFKSYTNVRIGTSN